jgi:hypothetical protein
MADGIVAPGGKPWLLLAEFDDIDGKSCTIDRSQQPPRWVNDNPAAFTLSADPGGDDLKQVATRTGEGVSVFTCVADAALDTGTIREVTTTPFSLEAPAVPAAPEAVSGKISGSEMP